MAMRPTTDDQQAAWQAQRDERMRVLSQQLEAGVHAIQTSDDFKRSLQTAARFHQYSPNNVFLILAQKPEAVSIVIQSRSRAEWRAAALSMLLEQ